MKIITDLDFKLNNTAVCIGKFDGLHRGHRLLFSEAGRSGLSVVMITFLFPDSGGIYTLEEKISLAGGLGIDTMVIIPVTEEFMHMSPEGFVREILVERCGAEEVVVGADFCFGYRRSGTADYLREAGGRYHFSTTICDKLMEGGEIISSTRIRRLLAEGRLPEANDLLQTPYFIQGVVEPGNRIGRRMMVPTANIRPAEEKVLPPHGVYSVRVLARGRQYDGVGNLGVKPTIPGENPVGIEVWLFDYEGDLYGQTLTVSLMNFQRPERKFSSVDELREQIRLDTDEAKRFLAGMGRPR